MKVIGIFGFIGSGKDEATKYISSAYNYDIVHMGNIVRAISKRLGRTENRDDLLRTQRECTEKYGMEYFGKKVVEKILLNRLDKIIINGIRRPEDVIVPKRHFGKQMIFVLIDAPAKTRFERMKLRRRGGDPETFAEFQRQENSEFRFFDIDETLKLVDRKIDNSGSVKQLHDNIDKLLGETNFK